MAEKRIDPNTAEASALQQLPGIGAGLARRIVAGGPYRVPEDLLNVSGLGRATLDRIRSRLVFELPPADGQSIGLTGPAVGSPTRLGDESSSADDGLAVGERAAIAGLPADRVGSARGGGQAGESARGGNQAGEPAGQTDRATAGRRSGMWAATAIAAASALCAVSLTLLVLLGINGTLDFGRHAAVRQIDGQVLQLQSDLSSTSTELSALRQRLEVLEGLSGRMTEVEGQLGQMQGQVERMDGSLGQIQQQMDELLQQTQAQADRFNRIESFLEGLQQLLGELFAAPEG